MAYNVKKAVTRKKRPPAKPRKPIWQRSLAEAIHKMSNPDANKFKDMGSIEMAEGRYGKNAEAMANPKAAYNWKLPAGKKTLWPKGKDGKDITGGAASGKEQVEIRFKMGGVAVPIMTDDKGREDSTYSLVDGKDLADELRGMLEFLGSLEKRSKDGKAFHKVAIEAACPKFAKGKDRPVAYDPSIDDWKTFNTKNKSIADLRAERINWLAKNKLTDHWANTDILTVGNGTKSPPKKKKR